MRQMNTREDWLKACLTRATAGWPCGADLPENTRISVGFPAKTRGRGARRVSEHYCPSESEGGFFEIFISPTMADAQEVARAVTFEAARIATGREPSEAESSALNDRALAVSRTLPAYPHAAIKAAGGRDAEADAGTRPGSRLLKVCCQECGYTARITRRWLRVALPSCPADESHGKMLVEIRE